MALPAIISGMSRRRDLNAYLAAEWGEDDIEVDEEHPFALTHLGTVGSADVFEFFDDGNRYVVFGGSLVSFMRAGSLTIEDLRTHVRGSAWIAEREPIDLDTSRIGDPRVPSAMDRRAEVTALLRRAGVDPDVVTVVVGEYLVVERSCIALVQTPEGERKLVIDGVARAVPEAAYDLSASQQLAFAVGLHLGTSENE